MNALKISWKSLWSAPLTAFLNSMLIAFGTGILTILLLASTQITQKLENNAKDIDLVVGAKGSPLQLILSSIYYIDFPTGNIPLKDATLLAHNPLVKLAVPLALGDSYNGFRIAGTDSNFASLYGLQLEKGRFWQKNFEVTIGSTVASSQNLKPGDKFNGGHGLTQDADLHTEHAYQVVGILKPQGNVTDNLVLTDIASIWKMHGLEEKHEATTAHGAETQPEITSLLIQYRSPMSVVLFPRMVNKSTNMQAASPALESARLFSLIGVGVDTLQWFAILIMAIASVSVFVSLYNSLKERKYDLAIMRTMGASRFKLLLIILFEGIILTTIGAIAGLALGHLALYLISTYQESSQAKLSGLFFMRQEIYLLLSGLCIGVLASVIPAIQAYRSDISNVLANG